MWEGQNDRLVQYTQCPPHPTPPHPTPPHSPTAPLLQQHTPLGPCPSSAPNRDWSSVMYFSNAKQLSWFVFLKPGSRPARDMHATFSCIFFESDLTCRGARLRASAHRHPVLFLVGACSHPAGQVGSIPPCIFRYCPSLSALPHAPTSFCPPTTAPSAIPPSSWARADSSSPSTGPGTLPLALGCARGGERRGHGACFILPRLLAPAPALDAVCKRAWVAAARIQRSPPPPPHSRRW